MKGALACGGCNSVRFLVTEDGASSYILECADCGLASEVTFCPGVNVHVVDADNVLPSMPPDVTEGSAP